MFASWRKWLVLVLGAVLGLGVVAAYLYWPELYLRSARRGLERRDYAAARFELERYLAARPDGAEAHLLLARLDRRSNQYAEAAKHLHTCERLGGFNEEVELERALIALQNGDFDARLEQICRRHAVAGGPDEFYILEALSHGYCKTYHLNEALFCLNRMLEIQPDSGYALRRRAWIYFTRHNYEKAEADYRGALEVDAEDRVARLGLAQLLLDVRKDAAAAFAEFDRLWAVQKDSATAVGRARSLLLLARTDEARQQLDAWLKDDADDVAALTERGKLALDERQPAVAEKLLRRAVARAPADPLANHTLYRCLVQQGKTADAEQCDARFKQAVQDTMRLDKLMQQLKQNPGDLDTRCQVANIFLRNNQEAEGERWLLTNLQMHPDHVPTHRALADYYRRSGNTDLAQRHARLAELVPSPILRQP